MKYGIALVLGALLFMAGFVVGKSGPCCECCKCDGVECKCSKDCQCVVCEKAQK